MCSVAGIASQTGNVNVTVDTPSEMRKCTLYNILCGFNCANVNLACDMEFANVKLVYMGQSGYANTCIYIEYELTSAEVHMNLPGQREV